MTTCPVCEETQFGTLVPSSQIEEECGERTKFVGKRLTAPASGNQLKDLTDFFHQGPADILICTHCGLLLRYEQERTPAAAYDNEEYDPDAIQKVYPQYLDAFRAKEEPYRRLLRTPARVLEIGSHYGAFLQTASEWGWRAEGVDIGKDTSRFARSKGFTVHDRNLTELNLPDATFNGVFIWNCFEQIESPRPVIAECHRILKTNGLLVVRTPNGLFYAICQKLINKEQLRAGAAEFLKQAMAYNNLLGFPYLYGYSRSTLERLIEPFGFHCDGMLNSELITLPLPNSPNWVEQEEKTINDEIQMLARSVLTNQEGVLAGPWIEMWFRKR